MRRLSVGTIVQLERRVVGSVMPDYRVEQLLTLADGVTLYKVKCDAEPFHRIVSEREVAHPQEAHV